MPSRLTCADGTGLSETTLYANVQLSFPRVARHLKSETTSAILRPLNRETHFLYIFNLAAALGSIWHKATSIIVFYAIRMKLIRNNNG